MHFEDKSPSSSFNEVGFPQSLPYRNSLQLPPWEAQGTGEAGEERSTCRPIKGGLPSRKAQSEGLCCEPPSASMDCGQPQVGMLCGLPKSRSFVCCILMRGQLFGLRVSSFKVKCLEFPCG